MSICMDVIAKQKRRFIELDEENGNILSFKKECIFARQLITKSDFAFNTAEKNPESLQTAILNVASIGISLNPALHLAYLVPRDRQIILDISYRGLIKLATDTGSIIDASAEIVRENDGFVWRGPTKEPEVSMDNPFDDEARGKIVGVYCIARLPGGLVKCNKMSLKEIEECRKVSKCANGPWKNWYEEMAKKTMIKRAYKTWPQSQKDKTERLGVAVEMLNENEGSAFTLEEGIKFMEKLKLEDPIPLFLFVNEMDDNKLTALFNSFGSGEKVKQKQRYRDQISLGSRQIAQWQIDYTDCTQAGDDQGAKEILDCDPALKQLILDATVQDQ